ncbi:MAG: hypothetical protein IH616_05445, partial [Gemmatimonadales bacterium]|nr:hypothetical protein [Gemmatimonadales bacterium]
MSRRNSKSTSGGGRVLAGNAGIALLPLTLAAQTTTPGYQSTSQDRQGVSITVYNQNFGLVREV